MQEEEIKSIYTGGVFGLLGIRILSLLITLFTLGIALPWALCLKERYIASHTIIDNKQLTFDGTGAQLFGNWIKWVLLSIITFGIFIFWLTNKKKKWVIKHTHCVSNN